MGITASGSDKRFIEEAGDRTVDAIDELNNSTSRLNKIMIFQTFVLIVLTVVIIRLTAKIVP